MPGIEFGDYLVRYRSQRRMWGSAFQEFIIPILLQSFDSICPILCSGKLKVLNRILLPQQINLPGFWNFALKVYRILFGNLIWRLNWCYVNRWLYFGFKCMRSLWQIALTIVHSHLPVAWWIIKYARWAITEFIFQIIINFVNRLTLSKLLEINFYYPKLTNTFSTKCFVLVFN